MMIALVCLMFMSTYKYSITFLAIFFVIEDSLILVNQRESRITKKNIVKKKLAENLFNYPSLTGKLVHYYFLTKYL